VDALDVRIVRTMGIRPYERWPKSPDVLKPAHIARTLGVTVDTVKDRIRRMEAAGVIAGYQVMPNLRHLGLTGAAFLFRVPAMEAKDRVVDEAQTTEGLLELHDFQGPAMCVDLVYSSPEALQGRLDALAKSTGDAAPLKFYDRDMPPAPRPLTRLDWRILRAMRGRARAPLADIAAEVGVSARTAKRHHDRMAAEGAFFTYPLLDPSKAPGMVMFELLFWLRADAGRGTANRILKAFDDRQVYSYVPASPPLGSFDLLLFADSVAQVDALRRQGEAIEGVARCEAWMFRGFHDRSAWLDRAIEERAEASLP
jgi:DNA-binding Lrp family transcriptional regulator